MRSHSGAKRPLIYSGFIVRCQGGIHRLSLFPCSTWPLNRHFPINWCRQSCTEWSLHALFHTSFLLKFDGKFSQRTTNAIAKPVATAFLKSMAPFDTCQYFGIFQRCALLIFLLLPVVISLNCYQGQGSTSAPPGTPAAW